MGRMRTATEWKGNTMCLPQTKSRTSWELTRASASAENMELPDAEILKERVSRICWKMKRLKKSPTNNLHAEKTKIPPAATTEKKI